MKTRNEQMIFLHLNLHVNLLSGRLVVMRCRTESAISVRSSSAHCQNKPNLLWYCTNPSVLDEVGGGGTPRAPPLASVRSPQVHVFDPVGELNQPWIGADPWFVTPFELCSGYLSSVCICCEVVLVTFDLFLTWSCSKAFFFFDYCLIKTL